MKIVFEEVLKVVKTFPEIKWFDWDFDQLTAFDIPPVGYPCVLFSIINNNPEEPTGMSIDMITFRIRYAEKVFAKANITTNMHYAAEALSHLERIDMLRKAISKIDVEGLSRPLLTNIRPVNRIDPRIYELTFMCALTEYDEGGRKIQRPPLDLELELNFGNE